MALVTNKNKWQQQSREATNVEAGAGRLGVGGGDDGRGARGAGLAAQRDLELSAAADAAGARSSRRAGLEAPCIRYFTHFYTHNRRSFWSVTKVFV